MRKLGAALCAMALALMLGSVLGGLMIGLVATAAVAFVALLLRVAGPIGAVMGLSLYLVAPGVLGESSFQLTLVALLAQLAILLLLPSAVAHNFVTHRRVVLLITMPVLVSTTFFLRYPDFGFLVAAWQIVWFNLVLLLHRPRALDGTMRALCCILFSLAGSYATSLLIGFHNPLPLTIGQRDLTMYLPATLTTGGDQSILGAPRFGPGVGEPGLTAFYLIPLAVWFGYRTGWRRWLGWSALVLVALFSQSTGVLVGGLVSAGLAFSFYLLKSGRFQSFILLLVVSGVAGTVAVQTLITTKASTSAASFSDRGIGASGTSASNTSGDINLLRILQVDTAAAVPLALALLLIIIAGWRNPLTIFSGVFFAVTALFLQPTQWFPGAWEMVLMALVMGWSRSTSAPVQHTARRAAEIHPPVCVLDTVSTQRRTP